MFVYRLHHMGTILFLLFFIWMPIHSSVGDPIVKAASDSLGNTMTEYEKERLMQHSLDCGRTSDRLEKLNITKELQQVIKDGLKEERFTALLKNNETKNKFYHDDKFRAAYIQLKIKTFIEGASEYDNALEKVVIIEKYKNSFLGTIIDLLTGKKRTDEVDFTWSGKASAYFMCRLMSGDEGFMKWFRLFP